GIAARTHFKHNPGGSFERLPKRLVNRWFYFVALAGVLRIARHADNLDLARLFRPEAEALSDRALISKMSFCKLLIDDSDALRARIVLFGEISSHEQRNLHCGEKILSHCVDLGVAVTQLAVWSEFVCQVN